MRVQCMYPRSLGNIKDQTRMSKLKIEREKLISSKNHAYLQSRIIRLLDRKYLDKWEIFSELSLVIKRKRKLKKSRKLAIMEANKNRTKKININSCVQWNHSVCCFDLCF